MIGRFSAGQCNILPRSILLVHSCEKCEAIGFFVDRRHICSPVHAVGVGPSTQYVSCRPRRVEAARFQQLERAELPPATRLSRRGR